ncbi:helix-turn-helix domain-containing protein [Neopusillimonas maritima]|uniref:Helix-turn-helix domain-containing protein n=2 Tax=Neopusillimonas maritima TaxID=2026239 RepID=A0ABX9N3Q3_9BURK|nr:helix-turn-helix domain-containing protein [Neopusillimonas maritima]RII84362.1 hypothetical protein CJO09_03885 [Neopusillimonas maritima]
MSVQAISWVLRQPINRSPAKHLLTVMAHYVRATNDAQWAVYPSITQLVSDTGQDRKTVMLNLKRLVEMGYLLDTGARVGATKSVNVYLIKSPDGLPELSEVAPGEEVPETVPLDSVSSSKFGTACHEGSSTVFHPKQYRFSPEAVPSFPTDKVDKVDRVVRVNKSESVKQDRGTRIPNDWEPSEKLREFALEKNPAWSEQDLREEAEKFRDYWVAAPGSKAVKKDWDATWRNWIRNAAQFARERGQSSIVSQKDDRFGGMV